MNKNTLRNLKNHKYYNYINYHNYYNCKNNIFNFCVYISQEVYDFSKYCDINKTAFHSDYVTSYELTDNFNKDRTKFDIKKEEILIKEKQIRKQLKLIKIFTSSHNICNDIQSVIISFLI